MTTIRIVQVQQPAGRKHDHVRAFGYREADPERLRVEVVMSPADAADIIAECARSASYEPVVEVEDSAWIYCVSNYGLKLVEVG